MMLGEIGKLLAINWGWFCLLWGNLNFAAYSTLWCTLGNIVKWLFMVRPCFVYSQSNGLVEKFVQIVKNLFYKAKDERTDIYKCLMIYRNTPLASTSKSPVQMLQQRSARSQLPMSNAAHRQLGIAAEQMTASKNQHLPSHDLHTGQEVMCQDFITRRWFPKTIKALCPEPRSYQIETSEGVIYRRMQNHLKPYKSHQKTQRREQSNQNINHKQSNTNQTSVKKSDNTKQSRPKRQIKIPMKLNL